MNSWAWLKDEYDLTDEQAAVAEWQFRYAGGFHKALWSAICRADDGNLDRLVMGFPVEVAGYRKFSRVDGWWQEVQNKFAKKEGK